MFIILNGKKVIFSGLKPTNMPTIGNYLGAIKNWAALQNDYKCLYCVVDMHSITVRLDPEELRRNARDIFALYIASGLDPEKNIIYFQSHVSAHAELAWILNCYTYMGELGRMTQFKDKSKKNEDNINAGLFTYPVLMAADILLYQTDLVPVGDDQRQHVELCRDIADRFNKLYGPAFTVPEAYTPKTGARIMDLQKPENKMSKSDENDSGTIFMLDPPDKIIAKVKRAVTDSGSDIIYSDDKPGIKNLLDIYACAMNKPMADCEKEFAQTGYGAFKKAVGEAAAACLEPIQKRYYALKNDPAYLDRMIKAGAEAAAGLALPTLTKVCGKVGFPDRII